MFRLAAILIIFTSIATIASDSKIKFSGDLTQGGLITTQVPKGTTAFLDGKKLKTQYGGKVLIGFHIDAKPEYSLVLELPSGKKLSKDFKISQRKFQVQRINNLPKKMVTPPKSTYDRIANDNKSVKKVRHDVIEKCDLNEEWIMPAEGRISGVYGSKRILNGKPKQPHFGLDIAAPTGTKIIAPKSGKVTLVHEAMYYTGKTVIMNHGCGLTSTFIHLSKIDVKVGDDIRRGQKIGEIGATGRVTGPHLDWRVNLLGSRLDPQLLID